jgi:hypothetical protein
MKFALVLFFLTSVAYGDELSRYSTEELMEEVGRRIDSLSNGHIGGDNAPIGGGSGRFALQFSCTYNALNVRVVTASQAENHQVNAGSRDSCQRQASFLMEKHTGEFAEFRLIKVCELRGLKTFRITREGLVEIEPAQFHGTTAACLSSLGAP